MAKTKKQKSEPKSAASKASRSGKSAKRKRPLQTIGAMDRIDFPELGLKNVEAKIDTGALTSVLHVRKPKLFMRNGEEWVRFRLKHPTHPAFPGKRIKMPVHDHKRIRNSFGITEHRYTIRTPIVIFGRKIRVEFSLTNRSKMECPVLLGRRLIYRKFVVDVAQKNLSYKRKRKKKRKKA